MFPGGGVTRPMRARVPDWLKDRYTVRQSDRAEAIVRRDFESVFDEHRLLEAAGTTLHVAETDDPHRNHLRKWPTSARRNVRRRAVSGSRLAGGVPS